jgi:hypothetical protein
MGCEILDAVKVTFGNPRLGCAERCKAEDICPFVNNETLFPKTEIDLYDLEDSNEE